jgi:hypothetical protein
VPLPATGTIVCVGRLCAAKGQRLLLEVVGRLVASGIPVQLVLAGDGPMRLELEQRIAQLRLGSQVRITGWISGEQVRKEILAARALVLPSFAEGLPVVIMEAMALRRPVLTTYIAGIPELVRSGENGWLFPAGSVEAMEQALRECLSMPIEALQKMGDAGFERVTRRHNVDLSQALRRPTGLYHSPQRPECPLGGKQLGRHRFVAERNLSDVAVHLPLCLGATGEKIAAACHQLPRDTGWQGQRDGAFQYVHGFVNCVEPVEAARRAVPHDRERRTVTAPVGKNCNACFGQALQNP